MDIVELHKKCIQTGLDFIDYHTSGRDLPATKMKDEFRTLYASMYQTMFRLRDKMFEEEDYLDDHDIANFASASATCGVLALYGIEVIISEVEVQEV